MTYTIYKTHCTYDRLSLQTALGAFKNKSRTGQRYQRLVVISSSNLQTSAFVDLCTLVSWERLYAWHFESEQQYRKKMPFARIPELWLYRDVRHAFSNVHKVRETLISLYFWSSISWREVRAIWTYVACNKGCNYRRLSLSTELKKNPLALKSRDSLRLIRSGICNYKKIIVELWSRKLLFLLKKYSYINIKDNEIFIYILLISY